MAMATVVEAMTAAASTLVSDAAVTLMAAQTAADGGPDGNNSFAAIAMRKN
jgi:hypothetical protein